MRSKKFWLLVLASLLVGCANDPNQMTAHERAVQTWNTTRASVMLSLAQEQYTAGDFDKCRQTLVQAIQMEPKSPAIHVLSAKVYIEEGQLDSAEQELKSARGLDPKLAVVEYLDGVIYQRWQQPEKSLEYYQAACDKAPTELAYLMAKAETMVTLGRQTEALALLQDKVAYFEHSPAIRDAVGMLLMQKGDVKGAVDMFRRASILASDELGIREHLAIALFQDKQYTESAEILAGLLTQNTLSKRADLYLTLAECQFEIGNARAARMSAQTACDLQPTSPEAWLSLAKISLELNDLHRAQSSLRKTLDLDPNNAQAYLLKGYLNLRQNNPTDALTCFNQSTELDPRDTTSLCMSGYALAKLNRPQEAAACYAKALKLNPTDDLAGKLMASLP